MSAFYTRQTATVAHRQERERERESEREAEDATGPQPSGMGCADLPGWDRPETTREFVGIVAKATGHMVLSLEDDEERRCYDFVRFNPLNNRVTPYDPEHYPRGTQALDTDGNDDFLLYLARAEDVKPELEPDNDGGGDKDVDQNVDPRKQREMAKLQRMARCLYSEPGPSGEMPVLTPSEKELLLEAEVARLLETFFTRWEF